MTRTNLSKIIISIIKNANYEIFENFGKFQVVIIFDKPKWYQFILKHRIKKVPKIIEKEKPVHIFFYYSINLRSENND